MYDAVSDLRKTRRFFSLRTKFVLFISLIIVAVCSTLSWYFIEQRREFMTDSLTNTGRILAENLAYNSRNAVFLEDQISLGQLIDGVLERMIHELGPNTTVVATGGYASLIGGGTQRIQHIDPNLTLEGLRLIYEKNKVK